jgi:hypothetical protein
MADLLNRSIVGLPHACRFDLAGQEICLNRKRLRIRLSYDSMRFDKALFLLVSPPLSVFLFPLEIG